jgi:DNA polymerase I-like protein with 3'-5' exonuclease and polymerase domains
VAGYNGNIYLDLADPQWRVVEITPDGWSVIDDSPVKFRRPNTMYPLPEPVAGGSLEELRPFVHLTDEDSWVRTVAAAVELLNPEGPYPVATINGEQGSSKTTLTRVFKTLVDPNKNAVRSVPRKDEDLMIAANNNWILCFDNLSRLSEEFSNSLCRLSTGGGVGTRELYTNEEEVVFDVKRPVVINGIQELAVRADLLDRANPLVTKKIPDSERKDEKKYWKDFNKAHPRILGALLTAAATALDKSRTLEYDTLPRMADFAIWVQAAESALGLETGRFMKAYEKSYMDANLIGIEASPIGPTILQIPDEWKGTATDLLTWLNGKATESTRKQRGWPKSGHDVSNDLRGIVPNLRRVGIEVSFGVTLSRTNNRGITINKVTCKSASASSASSADPDSCSEMAENAAEIADAPPEDSVCSASADPDVGIDDDNPDEAGTVPAEPVPPPVDDDSGVALTPDETSAELADEAVEYFSADGESVETLEQTRAIADELATVSVFAYDGEMYAEDPALSIDPSKAALDPHNAQIVALSIASEKGVYVWEKSKTPIAEVLSILKPVFEDEAIVKTGQNIGMFDAQFMLAQGIEVSPIADIGIQDQLIRAAEIPAYVFQENPGKADSSGEDSKIRMRGLGDLSLDYLGKHIDKTLQLSNFSEPLTEEQRRYCYTDAVIPLMVYRVQLGLLDELGLTEVARVENEAALAVAMTEFRGLRVDFDSWEASTAALDVQATAAAVELTESAQGCGTDYVPTMWGSANSAKERQFLNELIGDKLEKPLTGLNEAKLWEIKDLDPIIPQIMRHRKLRTAAGKKPKSWREGYSPVTGRVHPSINPLGTDAGRMSASHPNSQQLTKKSLKYEFLGHERQHLVAEPGNYYLEGDLPAIEARIIAEYSQDPGLLSIFQQGLDIHAETAALLTGKPVAQVGKDTLEREIAKTVRYAKSYGGDGVKQIQAKCREMDIYMSDEDAADMNRRFDEGFQTAAQWQEQQTRVPMSVTMLGRKRNLSSPPGDWTDRQGKSWWGGTRRINSPVQGTGADIFKLILIELLRTRSGEVAGWCSVLLCHDSILIEGPIESQEAAKVWLQNAMAAGTNKLLKLTAIKPEEVEIKSGFNYAFTSH